MVRLPVMIVRIVVSVKNQKKQDPPSVSIVMQVKFRILAVSSVKRAMLECLVILLVPIVKIAMLVNTVKAKKTTVSTLLIRRLVLIAQRGIHQVLVVPSAKPVGRGRTAMGASLVPKVNIVTAVTLLRSPADIVQLVTTVPTLVKVLVCRVFL